MDHKDDISNAMHQDYRKPSSEVDLTELWAVLNEIRHIRRYLKKWMRPKKVNSTLALATAEAWIQYEPKGVVLIITPWNFPFNLTISPLISAIAAGNCAFIKPSELTPHSSKVIADMVNDLFEEKEVGSGQFNLSQSRTFVMIFANLIAFENVSLGSAIPPP